MRCRLFLVAGLVLLGGCSRREFADSREEVESSTVDAGTVSVEPRVPRRPHPPARNLFVIEEASIGINQLNELMRAADRFMAGRIPDFAIKDHTRPWLDRQYIPRAWRVWSTDGRILGQLTLQVLQWDEGRTTTPNSMELSLEWIGSDWVLIDKPDRFTRDLEDAWRTLAEDWKAGERQLP